MRSIIMHIIILARFVRKPLNGNKFVDSILCKMTLNGSDREVYDAKDYLKMNLVRTRLCYMVWG